MKNNILKLLEERNISIRQLAINLNMDYAATYQLVHRKDLNKTQAGTLVNVAEYLGVDVKKLWE